MCAHFSRSWSRNAGRQPGASRLRGALTAAPSAELRRGAGLALRHSRQAGAAELHSAVGAVRAVRFDARDHVARGPTSPPTSPQPHLDLRNPCKSQGSDTPLSRSRKPVWAFPSIGGSNPPLSVVIPVICGGFSWPCGPGWFSVGGAGDRLTPLRTAFFGGVFSRTFPTRVDFRRACALVGVLQVGVEQARSLLLGAGE